MSETQTPTPLDMARMHANPTDEMQRLQAWMGSENGGYDQQAADDFQAYLESRPSKDDADKVHGPYGHFVAGNDVDNYHQARRDAHYESSMPDSQESKSIAQLLEEWDAAEVSGDKTIADDIQNTLLERVAKQTRREETQPDGTIVTKDGLSDEHANALLDKIFTQKEAVSTKNGIERDIRAAVSEVPVKDLSEKGIRNRLGRLMSRAKSALSTGAHPAKLVSNVQELMIGPSLEKLEDKNAWRRAVVASVTGATAVAGSTLATPNRSTPEAAKVAQWREGWKAAHPDLTEQQIADDIRKHFSQEEQQKLLGKTNA